MKTLVLSGGSIKGAFQAGAIHRLFNLGYQPDAITGISVGALNATFLASSALKFPSDDDAGFSWSAIGRDLYEFWLANIRQPDQLVRKRSAVELALGALTSSFNGLLDNQPLQELVQREVNFSTLGSSPVQIRVGSVNMDSSHIEYVSPNGPDFFKHLMASTAIPILMPGQHIGSSFHLDGGIRDVAPLREAVRLGATEIVVIATQSEKLEPIDFRHGNLMAYAERMMEIIVNECVNNDIALADRYNTLIQQCAVAGVSLPALADKREIKIRVIRPSRPLNIDIQSFTKADIELMLDEGFRSVPADFLS